MEKYAYIFDKLPDDFAAAAAELLRRVEEQVLSSAKPAEHDYSEACSIIAAYYDANGQKIPNSISYSSFALSMMPNSDIGEMNTVWHRRFLAFSLQIRDAKYNYDRRLGAAVIKRENQALGYATLSADEKKLISKKIQDIRDLIGASSLDDRKKNALYRRLEALQAEVSKNGTLTDRFFSFMFDLSYTAGEMANNAKPAIAEFKEILDIIMKSRAKNENVSLPGPADWPQLPPPSP